MSPPNRYDSILLVAFGGPTPGCCKKYDPCPGEAYCFVEGIAGTGPSQAERVRAIVSHYTRLGGFSPFNPLTFKQASALEAALRDRDIDVPVYAGFRNWTPTIHEVIREMAKNGHRRIFGIIMAPHQSKVSWDEYQEDVSQAIAALDGDQPTVHYLDPWYTHSGYVSAIADLIRVACKKMGRDRFDKASLIFTSHAIPQPAARTSPYIQQYSQTAAAVAKYIGREKYTLAYQSAVENSPVPWTQPDINDVIREKRAAGVQDVIVSPIGFLCNHIEVLYDLDVEAKATAEACGVGFTRVETVGSHPAFIGMLADLACEKFKTHP